MDRFWSKVKQTGEDPYTSCWLWTAAKTRDGYGRFRLDGRAQRAHRLVYEAMIGDIPAGYQLDHRCRVRHCLNPFHLEPVTPAENTRRGNKAKITAEDVREIRERYAAGGVTQCELAEAYGVGQQHISDIVRGEYWAEAA